MSESTRSVLVRITPVTKAEHRVATALALEPGGPPTAQARIANRVIRTVLKRAWAGMEESPEGMLRLRRFVAMSPPARPPRGVEITREDTGPVAGEWIRAGMPDESEVFLYLHGGGFFFGSPAEFRGLTWRLAAATGRPVLALAYRLAPEHTPSDALEDVHAAYRYLLDEGYPADKIVVGGDSAGGHLTLALLLALRERGEPLPRAAVTLHPWADLACEAESHTLNRETDPLVPADRLAWAGSTYLEGKKETDPLFSPVRGDYTGLPPLMVVSSDSEILRDDARDVAARARAAGVEVVHHEWDGLSHDFALFADWIPEGKAAFRHIAEFLRSVE
jgi:monoterpene epsilon-lactone hydrolase